MNKEQLDLVTTDDLLEALKRRSEAIVLHMKLRTHDSGTEDATWFFEGRSDTCIYLCRRLEREIHDDVDDRRRSGHLR